ncbi:hypothetical protein PpBr36_02896 [Pyricularia pennisetigena]|uniref:hypothetical protein n=1 Tax=Pyricularia pennisetigena TaxID=1578925 RepID=UPI00115357DE|nr:hypothetical protein PpBr36_02896 [Pyricularia pennisetigena]TLS31262.1 hypothetical protein PpBr36_02896 [Pyricularia pennisetigena]
MCPGHGHVPGDASAGTGSPSNTGPGDSEPFPWEIGAFDAHCHPTTTPASIAQISKMRTRAITVMASRAQDQALSAIAADDHGVPTRLQLKSRSADPSAPGGRVVPAFGYHPWFSHLVYDDSASSELDKAAHFASVLKPSPDSDPDFLASLPDPEPLSSVVAAAKERLLRYPTAMVGEVGLDKAFRLPQPRETGPDGEIDPPAEEERDMVPGGRYGRMLSKYRVNLPHQERILLAQVALAGELGRAVSVHGVQCSGLLLEALSKTWKGHEREVVSRRKQRLVAKDAQAWEEYDSDEEVEPQQTQVGAKPFPPRICLHSFSGSAEVLKQYMDPRIPSKIFFSFSVAINMGTPSVEEKVPEIIRTCPDDRILVETDLHLAGNEMDSMLEKMYRHVCRIKGWGLKEGMERIARNYEDFVFG